MMTFDQFQVIWFGLIDDHNAVIVKADDCDRFEEMVCLGFLEFLGEAADLRNYKITETGAAAAGFSLPD